ncbi:ABC transporter substrate-binding protein [Neopusillimonas aromaticivorans]|uniref:ABC transporter substrate-binding protein n=1 Tax=Neopusillimonas aromaticivorans TaxID=2979868 RepID=UPI0025940D43|nr:ABC transporter substrate-binding protein [Neopusillimonas aromaticivorans]NLZ11035.1 ABC transporter substrate-binding protein [Alcaligenaceae bacterium]WJJ94101.1 ABC transporter substrate-binding protein [Neopusillimonas aromaticivorans]
MRISKLVVSALIALSSSAAMAQTAVRFALDWRFEGPAAPYFVALDKGYYKAEGLDVTIDPGASSVEPINRVATGTYQMGFADINSLVKYRDNPQNPPVKAVMMVYDTPAFSIVTLKDKGISKPKDLEGKILGAPAPDGAYAQWPIFVAANGIDASKVKVENVGFPVREPMLAQGKVDAITGFWFSSYMNLKANGVKDEDIVVLLMRDYGVDLYGNALMVNPDFAKNNPEAVKGFVKATIKGIQETLKDPEAAIDSLMKRNAIANRDVELQRLKMSLERNFVSPDVLKNGLGNVDKARFEKAIDQIGLTFKFTNKPKADDVFTAEFLPPADQRMVK